jgi:hypothetical protein
MTTASAKLPMGETTWRGRRAFELENETVRLTVTAESANVAGIEHKSGVNPLWTPPWPSVEPSAWRRALPAGYGANAEAPVLASIMGHSICLDTYGAPSAEEASAGIPIHGEAFTLSYDVEVSNGVISSGATLPLSQIRFERRLRLGGTGDVATVIFDESVTNLAAADRPIAWTQHVTLGPPFLEPGQTLFHASLNRAKVIDSDFGGDQLRAAEFEWPYCPDKNGGVSDLRKFPAAAPSGGFTTHLVDTSREQGFFVAWTPASRIAFGYVWNRSDFPWLCRWEENSLRQSAPWNGRTVACGMEFGVSPFVESRREMVDRGSLFGVPAYRWLPAMSTIGAQYCAFIGTAPSIPEEIEWDGAGSVRFIHQTGTAEGGLP